MTALADTHRDREPALLRFDRVERVVHWTTATLFGVLMLTGAALYAGPISTVVGRRDLVRTIHVVAGLALPVPIVVGLLGAWGRRLRADVGRLNRWSPDDRAWVRKRTRHTARLSKFNPGQKVNAAFLGASIVVMLVTGVMLRWYEPFSLDWRTGATFVHDWLALGIWIAVIAHIVFAVRDPVALRGMARGTVSAWWARTQRPRWYEEETGRAATRLKARPPSAAQESDPES
jgi:formate dehydrogenase subunit gamma